MNHYLKNCLIYCFFVFSVGDSILLTYPAMARSAAQDTLTSTAYDSRISSDLLGTSNTRMINRFITNSGLLVQGKSPTCIVMDINVVVRLLTPINSNFNHAGDMVSAVVTESSSNMSEAILPVGTQLQGYVESCKRSGRMLKDGEVVLRFYRSHAVDGNLLLSLAPNTGDGILGPEAGTWEDKLTRKKNLRNFLMFASKLAIPLALGSSGTSLAITAGAGAVIGGVLAENGQVLKGAVRGAWEGAGLSIFDPLILKGKTVILPTGTALNLHLNQPIEVSAAFKAQQSPNFASEHRLPVRLYTSAKILNPQFMDKSIIGKTSSSQEPSYPKLAALYKIKRYLNEKNLAQALAASEQALNAYPEDEQIVALHQQLIKYVTGDLVNIDLEQLLGTIKLSPVEFGSSK